MLPVGTDGGRGRLRCSSWRTFRSKSRPRTPRNTVHGCQPCAIRRWATINLKQHMMYLQDPKVTPFRAGKSGIPPAGVCSRVAREAKRSWKGSKQQPMSRAQSGSRTPTEETFGAFVQWPHTCAATRSQLRELCKLNAASTSRTRLFLANSPTPFGRTTTATRFLNRRTTPARSPSVFSSSDMVMSLAVSTSASMQLQGPLAQLTNSHNEDAPALPTIAPHGPPAVAAVPSTPPPIRPRLGSPFSAKSYGPSSSSSLGATLGSSLEVPRQNLTLGPRRSLRSPVRLSESKPTTHKRPFGQPMMEPRKSKRPSLASDLWTEPSEPTRSSALPFGLDSPAAHLSLSRRSDDLTGPRANLQELFEASGLRAPQTTLMHPGGGDLPMERSRLGSPFDAGQASHSFPRRVFSASGKGLGALRRPFATVQQSAERPSTPPRSSLATRLAYIDERLRDFRQRDRSRRRSQSP